VIFTADSLKGQSGVAKGKHETMARGGARFPRL
jgi:hypothetical protein